MSKYNKQYLLKQLGYKDVYEMFLNYQQNKLSIWSNLFWMYNRHYIISNNEADDEIGIVIENFDFGKLETLLQHVRSVSVDMNTLFNIIIKTNTCIQNDRLFINFKIE